MIRPPPRSPLFPYPTLFRSDIIDMAAPAIASLGIAHVPEGRGTFGDLTVLENLRVGAIHRRDKDGIEQDIARMQTDRKSTRLNSSHLVISYAVFCLKKKNNT